MLARLRASSTLSFLAFKYTASGRQPPPTECAATNLTVLGAHKVGKRLWLAVVVVGTVGIGVCGKWSVCGCAKILSISRTVSVVVAVSVAIVLRSDVLHLVDAAALGAALDGAVARRGEPDDGVRVDGVAGAAEVLLVAKRLDDDGVVERA